jgi:hypothetical protein
MDPEDPDMAQQIVTAYATVLERFDDPQRFPASISALPFSRETIKTAIRTSTRALVATRQLTEELREFLETAYVALADFVDDEMVRLMQEYNAAAATLAVGQAATAERMKTPAWQTLQQSSALAGQIARSIADDAERLRAEFRTFESAPA